MKKLFKMLGVCGLVVLITGFPVLGKQVTLPYVEIEYVG